MDVLWEDRDIRFDVNQQQLNVRPGEFVIETFDSVEDTKGNNGERGTFKVTNLRLMWYSNTSPRINLSIGMSCVTRVVTKNIISKLRGNTEAMCLSTRANNNKYEFIFTNEVSSSASLFVTTMAVSKAYDSSKLYRELKLRGAIIRDKQLRLLPKEEIAEKVNGVWNLASDQGNLGTFVITNIRVVWFANMNEHFNVSIPYLQIQSVKVRNSKFGLAMVIESTFHSGGYVLGFRIDPSEKLNSTAKMIKNLHNIFTASPFYGVEYERSVDQADIDGNSIPAAREPVTEDIDIDMSVKTDACVAYMADGEEDSDLKVDPVFCPELGLAIEPLKRGYTLESLWKVL